MAVRQMLIAGRYRLREPVGSGGMGRVWLARDEMLDRDVAVKEFVPPAWMSVAEQARLRDRTLREARSAARLNHPHVVKIYDVVHTDEQPWIVMEYVPSRSMHQVIGEDGPYDPRDAARIGLDVLAAITAAHRAGVLHRDVKPHNVLIGHDGRVVLTDFGLATFVDDGSVTGPGLIVGSPQYVSPERARDGASTVESDLWSFGATLYAAVEGRSPFARENAMATLTALATEEPDAPVRAGPLAPVLLGLLRRDPLERLSAREVEERLGVLAGVPLPGMMLPGVMLPGMTLPRGRAAVPAPRKAEEALPAPRGGPEAVAPPAAPGSPSPQAALPASAPAALRVDDASSPPGPPFSQADRSSLPDDHPSAPLTMRQTSSRGRWRRSRVVLAGTFAVVLLAGAGVAGGLLLRDGSDGDDPVALPSPSVAPASPSVVPSSGAGGGTGGFSPVTCLGDVRADLPRTPQPGAEKLRDGWALYGGWSYFTQDKFRIAVPDGWTYEKVGSTLCFRDPDTPRVLSVDAARNPKGDPVTACRAEVSRLALPGYQEYGINRVAALTRAADWEYAWSDSTTRRHAITRWVAADGKAYAYGLMARDLDWPATFALWGLIVSTFSTEP